MKLLLDTHAFLFWVSDDRRLPRRARAAIADPRSAVHLSAASVWEIRIKVAKGKLTTSFADVPEEARRHRFDLLPITADHAQRAGDLPLRHEDPFDRMLIAQAMLEDARLVTGDSVFGACGVATLWS